MNDTKAAWKAARTLMSEVTEVMALAVTVAGRVQPADALARGWLHRVIDWQAIAGLSHSIHGAVEKANQAVDRAAVSVSRTLDVAFVRLPGFERDAALHEGDFDLAP